MCQKKIKFFFFGVYNFVFTILILSNRRFSPSNSPPILPHRSRVPFSRGRTRALRHLIQLVSRWFLWKQATKYGEKKRRGIEFFFPTFHSCLRLWFDPIGMEELVFFTCTNCTKLLPWDCSSQKLRAHSDKYGHSCLLNACPGMLGAIH